MARSTSRDVAIKMIEHRSVTINFPLGALSHHQLARAYALSCDTPKARTSYQGLFALWHDADPDMDVANDLKLLDLRAAIPNFSREKRRQIPPR